MSGTSLDGLDLALVEFIESNQKWSFSLIKGLTIGYSERLQSKLKNAIDLSAADLNSLDQEFGHYIGLQIHDHFKDEHVDLIASHGHTIFHQPRNGMTLQIGSGEEIHKMTKLPTIYDFRSMDVALGGEGAPLVPIGDHHLFERYDACLNLGGIANCSFMRNGNRIAFDIAPFNMVLNKIANEIGLSYDEGGNLAKQGKKNDELMLALNAIEYYQQSIPKSLGYEDFLQKWEALISNDRIPYKDRLHSYVLHVSEVISKELNHSLEDNAQILVTGGGTYNAFFIDKLQSNFKGKVRIPDHDIIDFKEAIIFAFMGVLRSMDRTNSLASVTGASRDSSTGKMIRL